MLQIFHFDRHLLRDMPAVVGAHHLAVFGPVLECGRGRVNAHEAFAAADVLEDALLHRLVQFTRRRFLFLAQLREILRQERISLVDIVHHQGVELRQAVGQQ